MQNIFSKSTVPAVSLIGRPNVGKSTLFNRLTKKRASIVHAEPGVTRDRIYSPLFWDNKEVRLIDTGGLEDEISSELSRGILKQTKNAIDESNVIVMLTDATQGVHPTDREIAKLLRKSKKPVILAVNKCDSERLMAEAADFYGLGFDKCVFISCAQGLGIEDLLNKTFGSIPGLETKPAAEEGAEVEKTIGIAVIGKPNVGKSSFLNKLLGSDRHLISNQPGTTVDAVDTDFEYGGQKYSLIDTAGIRKKRSIFEDLEKMAVSSSLGAIDRCSVALMLIDPTEGITEQDMKVAAFAEHKAKGLVIVVNKWDLAREHELKHKEFTQQIRDKMPFIAYAPIVFVSALTGRNVFDVLETAKEVEKQYEKRVGTGQVNRMLQDALEAHQLPVTSGRKVKIFYATQVSAAPPTFIFTCSNPQGVHFSYRRY
ncbi:MAG: ribosome biogenesis GTPase Der, partial [bacterium]|nr:ribosome biogenesis GTPase Der [bacterium]